MVAPARSRTRLTATLVAVAAACSLAALPSAAGAAPAPAESLRPTAVLTTVMSRTEYEQRLAYWINRARDKHSKRSVTVRPCVDGFAGKWSRHLAVKAKFEHQDLGPIMQNCGLSSAGEIIAMGGVTPRRMVRMWLESDAHRSILLSRTYRIAGVGAYHGDNGAWYGVVDFGRR